MIGDGWREGRDWLAGFEPPASALPLDSETDAANRRQLRRGWVDITYVTDLEATDALRAIAGMGGPRRERTGQVDFLGPGGRFSIQLAASGRALPLGLTAIGRVRPFGEDASLVEAQMGRAGGDLASVVVPLAAVLSLITMAVQGLAGIAVSYLLLAVAPVLAIGFVLARLLARSGEEGLAVLHGLVPPSAVQPAALPVCGSDAAGAPVTRGTVRAALGRSLARARRVDLTTDLTPREVRDALRAQMPSRNVLDRVTGTRRSAPICGQVTKRHLDVGAAGPDGNSTVGGPRVWGSIVPTADGSMLHVRVGRSSVIGWAIVVLGSLLTLGGVASLISWVGASDDGLLGMGLGFLAMGTAFLIAVVAGGWRPDDDPGTDAYETVVEAVQGRVHHPPAPPPAPWGDAPRPPLTSPYRR